MNRWKISHYFQLLSLIVLGACTTEYEQQMPTDGSISFQVNESYVENESSRNLALPIQGVNNVVLTIENEDGSQTIFDRKSLPILGFGDEILIEEINLSQGSYQISAFYLTDSSGNILYATPIEGSEFGEFLAQPLPIPFEVTASESQNLNLEIISTAGKSPEPFGFESGMAGFRETFYFFISTVREKVDDFMDFIPAELTVSQGDHLLTQQLNGKLNKIVLPKNSENFDLTITYKAFQPIEKEISYDSLLLFENHPLIIELTKKRADEFYIGGTFDGDVQLSSQAAVDSFGLKGYDIINGNLTIGQTPEGSSDPIQDLSALATIEQVDENFIISGNPDLQSLEGLKYIQTIAQDLIIRSNPKLESFSDFTSLEYLTGLNLTNNPSIQEFDGLEHLADKLERLHIEGMVHFIDFSGFENATNLQKITIQSNTNITHLDFPSQTEIINSKVTVKNNPSLISFGGEAGGFMFIENLHLEDNENLVDLNGLLQTDGEGVSELIVKFLSKVTTLTPLFFNEEIEGIHLYYNESLADISAIGTGETINDAIAIKGNPKLKTLTDLRVFRKCPSIS
ncbi:hemagglutinin protein [Cyclobacterium qasimii]|uniref:Hemagglutinin protein n=1 Tax=Cyclobacterium qasimii M12-11B TaxID=641524 RepID=S7VDG0_9BACT|nr:hemagglutinin protein [Cyclobacterium qasimii]EPR68250.1 hemagglutinin protein [Cyclobacterium qasimii M12-11B]